MPSTFPLLAPGLTRRVIPRLIAVNTAISDAANSHGVILVEMEDLPTGADPRVWSPDRIHLNSIGHTYLANAFTSALENGERFDERLPPAPPTNPLTDVWRETSWIARYLLPKVGRLLQGRSSGDGRVAKRPGLKPIE